jgi:hypothetical protein
MEMLSTVKSLLLINTRFHSIGFLEKKFSRKKSSRVGLFSTH